MNTISDKQKQEPTLNVGDWIVLAYHHDCLTRLDEDLKHRVKRLCKKSSMKYSPYVGPQGKCPFSIQITLTQ